MSPAVNSSGAVTLHPPPEPVDRTGDKETVGIPVVNANAAWDAAMPDVLKNIGPGVSTTKPELSKLLTTDTARSSKRLLAQGAAAQGSKNRPASSTSSATTLSGDPRAASKGTSSSPQANSSGNGNAAPVTPENLLNTPPTAFGPPAGIGNTPDVSQPATGEIGRPPNLPPTQIKQDQVWMQSQFDIMNKRYLIGEAIALSLPQPSQLMSLGATLPPIKLEANYTQPISLKDSLLYSLDNNLAIRIANANKSAQKWLTVGQFGGFLPNVIMNFQHQFLKGSSLIGGVIPSVFDTPNTTAQAGFQMFGFQGGSVLFGSLSQLHQFRAAREQLHGTINDTLLAVTRAYYNLVQNQVLLQIQTRAVEVARAQVLLNQQLESAGTGTKFQVLQSDTQLALNEQNLLGQEVALRNSAIDLATTMNLNAAVNFLSVETEIRKVRLVDPSLDINTLISLAVLNRPELRQYEQLRIAARRNIQLSSAGLYPQFQFFGSINGNGATLTKSYVTTQPSFTTVAVDSPPTSTSIVSPNGNISSLSDAIVPPGGKQTTANGKAGTSNTRTLVGAAEQFVPPQVQSRQMRKSYTIGVRVDWNYNNLGVPTASNIWAAKALARQALLNSNQQLLNVLQQVRESYLLSQTAEREIEVTTKAVISATEELRLAQVRLANGVGTNIDVINAQRDFVTALVNKAQAIIQFNIAQAQLLHDMGLITVDTLTSGRLVKRESN